MQRLLSSDKKILKEKCTNSKKEVNSICFYVLNRENIFVYFVAKSSINGCLSDYMSKTLYHKCIRKYVPNNRKIERNYRNTLSF